MNECALRHRLSSRFTILLLRQPHEIPVQSLNFSTQIAVGTKTKINFQFKNARQNFHKTNAKTFTFKNQKIKRKSISHTKSIFTSFM